VILYLGTTSLTKLYVDENYSGVVREWVKNAEIIATCRVAYTEMISVLEIRFKRRDISKTDYNHILKRFTQDWPNVAIVDFDERLAGLYVTKYGLTRFDAIHLSAATLIKKNLNGVSLSFSSTNENLCKAAAAEGLKVLSFK
jgi:predicted nucleic acid-binding protein